MYMKTEKAAILVLILALGAALPVWSGGKKEPGNGAAELRYGLTTEPSTLDT
jgi:hypothetical protein